MKIWYIGKNFSAILKLLDICSNKMNINLYKEKLQLNIEIAKLSVLNIWKSIFRKYTHLMKEATSALKTDKSNKLHSHEMQTRIIFEINLITINYCPFYKVWDYYWIEKWY